MSQVKKQHLHVEIREVDGNNLLVAESRVVPFNHQVRTVFGSTGPKVCPTHIYETGLVANPVNGSVVFGRKVLLSISVLVNKVSGDQKVTPWTLISTYGMETNWESDTTPQGNVRMEHLLKCSAELTDDHQWGVIQLRCVEEHMSYERKTLYYGDLLTVFVYADPARIEDGPFPPVLTLASLSSQNYAPLRAGQLLQVVANQSAMIEDYQSGDRSLLFYNQTRVGRATNLVCHRYECLRQPVEHQIMYVNGPTPAGLIVPPICQQGEDYFSYVFEPWDTMIDCSNLTSVRLRFATAIPQIKSLPSNYISLPAADSSQKELIVRFVKPLRSLHLLRDGGVLSFKPMGK